MNEQITIREAVSPEDTDLFLRQLHEYFIRDIFPDPHDEDRAYFLSTEYINELRSVHEREQDRCHWLFFNRNGQDIGLAMPVIYNSEDGKCFIMEFCVYPEFRGSGCGTGCAKRLLDWARDMGAKYAELNCSVDARRVRFWEAQGFVKNGVDEWGVPLMLFPPEESIPFSVEILKSPENWQLLKLENGFLSEIGEECLTEERQKQLQHAVRNEEITFFIARRSSRFVGMCSVTKYFSTFSCGDVGVFEDFYIEPAFRKKGLARALAQAAQAWCKAGGMSSLTVCCAPCDVDMYSSLGFELNLGTGLACPL